jgi:hypothetical protein
VARVNPIVGATQNTPGKAQAAWRKIRGNKG